VRSRRAAVETWRDGSDDRVGSCGIEIPHNAAQDIFAAIANQLLGARFDISDREKPGRGALLDRVRVLA
jgi:hypothetical protein